MRIESEIKLDYRDVLLRPKRSELTSRNEVDLMRTFTFKNAGADGAGNPITVGQVFLLLLQIWIQ